ncbi:unnamed protein product [Clonostachys rosea f. rosea IK726]|uniref:Uncharacterized protein n=1 Tax=Clonostachys rosea f. rosea IK726 TaxID=1349383 RepID=A0ACA9UBV1_BIOOC|nr:unnamed protein product [Clonostachys rosea f. rosea IK726]
MPSAINANGATLRIEPLPKDAGKKTNFGVVIHDLDLSNIGGMTLVQNQQSPLADQTEADTDVDALKKAIWENKVVIVKGQKDLPPIKQWELVTRFDPDAPKVHSHGSLKTFNKQGGILSASRDVIGMPGAENVRLIGKGYQGADHYGIKDKTVKKPLSHDWHVTELPAEEFESGHTRFQRWHLDAPLYERDPAWFTTLRCIKRPTSPKVTVHWDDGSGQTLETEPGLTAFLSNVQTYDLMTPDEKAMADHSWVEYAPHPYQWMGNCRGNPNGLGVASQGYEKPLEELGEWNPKL